MNKHFLIVFIAFLCGQHIISQSIYDSSLNEFLTNENIQNATVGIELISGSSGTVLMQHQSNKTLLPASIHKLYTTSYALNQLGWNYSFKTTVLTNGKMDIQNQTLNGDLILSLVGDPSLESRYFDSLSFLVDLKHLIQKLKIKKINGSLKIKPNIDNYQVNSEWLWGDLGNYYGAGASGINFYDNTVKYYFDTPSNGKKVEFKGTFPEDPKLKFSHTIKSANIRNDQSYLYGAPYSQDRFGIGSLPSNRTDFVVKGSMHDPEYMLSKEFSAFLKDSNFNVSGAALGNRLLNRPKMMYDSLTLLYKHSGQSILDIIKLTNEKSINLFAEGMLNLVGFEQNSFGSTTSGIRAVYENFQGKINLRGMKLKDGSGLSRKNAVSAHNFIDLLSYIHRSPLNDTFRSSLAVAGESGTLKNICRSQAASGRMFAKSGTLSNVKAYAGFVNTISGKRLAFAIIVNNFEGPRYQMVKKMERIFNAMASY